jgi:hypothetical protein
MLNEGSELRELRRDRRHAFAYVEAGDGPLIVCCTASGSSGTAGGGLLAESALTQ